VITKIDRADPARVVAVREALHPLLPGRPMLAVSSLTGEGRSELVALLDQLAANYEQRSARGRFRLSIDRAFVLKGAGLIVTGTAASGRVAVGDGLQLLTRQSRGAPIRVRVRSLHVQGEPAQSGLAGQRCALNLVGDVHWQAVERGDWLTESGCTPPGLRFDARVTVLEDVPSPLRHLQAVKLYLGAARLCARAFLLDDEGTANRCASEPGSKRSDRLVQFILEHEIHVSWGDRFLLQDEGENVILGGGTVLVPNAPQRRKKRAQRMKYLEALSLDSPDAALQNLLPHHSQFVDFAEFAQSLNLRDEEADALAASVAKAARTVRLRASGGDWLLPRDRFDSTKAQLYRAVRQWHTGHPADAGMQVQALFTSLGGTLARPLFNAILDALVRDGSLALSGGLARCSDHRASADPLAEEAWDRLRRYLLQAGLSIPLYSKIDRDLALDGRLRTAVIGMALRAGLLHRVSARRVALSATLVQIAGLIGALAERCGTFSVIEAKAQLGLGRDLTIELLEYFDSIRFTQRRGNGRTVLDKAVPQRLFASPAGTRQ
jgi:selenocysteine-specific elongation factor